MGAPVQIFAAPGDEDESLLVELEPWLIGRAAFLPLWDWYLILDETSKRDPDMGDLLSAVSGCVDPAADDSMSVPDDRLSTLIDFLDGLANEFAGGVDLSAEQVKRELGDYDSTSYARMLQAVIAVLDEARRTGEPFLAWNE